MRQPLERDLKKTAIQLCAEYQQHSARLDLPNNQVSPQANNQATSQANTQPNSQEGLAALVESRLIAATWTLRRMPDREQGFLRMRGSLWPDMLPQAGTYPSAGISSRAARRLGRISAKEIDQMQPALDLLTLLPDIFDRQILFWTAWHHDGEAQDRIRWAKVRRSLGVTASRWTLKRRYDAGILWLGALVALQA